MSVVRPHSKSASSSNVPSEVLVSLHNYVFEFRGYAVAQLVGHCATSRKVAGSIPDGVIGIFH
jgi:hypothetical protein